jgi:hypothetical protein
MTASNTSLLDRLDETTLLYLGVAGALLLLRNVKSLAFGDYKVEFQEIRQIAEEARDSARIAEDAVAYGTTAARAGDEPERVSAAAAAFTVEPGQYEDDPWKGQFGGSPDSNDRRLRATVESLSGRSDWFAVTLIVESTKPKHNPLSGSVQYFLHPTFANNRPTVPVNPDGKATLHLKAWGAFTVGVLADDGATRLELDLSELESAPHPFRIR